MKKWIVLVALVAAGLLAYVAAGPYLTIRAIGQAVQEEDARALARHVDFPALRTSLKAQVSDAIVREAGAEAQASVLGALGLTVATGLAGGMVDAMVTPLGMGALMEGHKLWNRGSGLAPPSRGAPAADGAAATPLKTADNAYESPSRFTATVYDDRGRPVVFVLTRQGLRWKLSDIRLPR